jgi:hypothetical protein
LPRSRSKTAPGIPFIHAADIRLDVPVTGLRRLPAPVAAAVRDAALGALDGLVDLAIGKNVAFVALASGICTRGVSDVRGRQHLERAMARLRDAGIPVFIALGPEDPRGPWPGLRDLPSNVTVFPDDRTTTMTIERDGDPVFVVHGRSVARVEDLGKAAGSFSRSRGAGTQVGILPIPGGPDTLATTASLISRFDAPQMDYWALGGTPELRVVSDRGPWVVFPGSIQGRGVESAELGPKGALIVEASAGTLQAPAFAPLDRVRIVNVDCDAKGYQDLAGLAAGFVLRVAPQLGKTDGHAVIARAVVRGEGPLAASFHASGRADELLADLRELSAGREPFLWWDSVINDTAPRYRRATFAQRGDLAAEVVAELDALASDDDGRRALLSAAEGAVVSETSADWLRLSDDAENQVLLAAEQLVLAALEEPSS